jgi:hypothetical protein
MIGLASKRRFGVLVALAAATLAGGPAFADGHGGGGHGGGGGGHYSGGGGGGHFAGGGGHSFGGGSFGGARGAPHFAGGGVPHYAGGGARFAAGGGRFAPRAPAAPGAHYGGGFAARSGAHVGYAPRPGFSNHASVATHGTYVGGTHGYVAGRGGYGRPGYGRPGPGYGRAGWAHGGYHGYNWGGGYWHGAFWPRAYYGWGFPLFLPVLPAIYATYYWGGIPYYYANNVYYTWNPDQNGYTVTDPPPVDGTAGSTDDSNNQPANASDVYAYPQNGQTDEQQSNDRYECHTWARSQTGFDPTVSSSTGNADDYRRAMIACMNARGYSSQ